MNGKGEGRKGVDGRRGGVGGRGRENGGKVEARWEGAANGKGNR